MLLVEPGKRCQPVTAGSEWFQVLCLGLGLGQFQWLCKHFFFFLFPTVLFSSHCVKRPFANRGRKLAEKLAVPGEPRCRSSSKTHRIPWARCVQIPFYSSPCRSVLNGGEKANPRANTVFSPYYHAFLASGSTAASGWGGAGTAGWDPACTHALSSPLLWKQTTGQLFHAAHVGGSPQAE